MENYYDPYGNKVTAKEMTPSQLIKIRRELGMTQKQLGKELGFTRQHITEMENGHRTITKTTEMAIKWLSLDYPGRLAINKR